MKSREMSSILAMCDDLDTFKEELGIEQLTIAYSRPNTIGQIVAKAKLHQAPNREVSKYLTGELH
mgnify:CR=1 FL=1